MACCCHHALHEPRCWQNTSCLLQSYKGYSCGLHTQVSAAGDSEKGKGSSLSPSQPSFPPGTSFETQPPSRLLPSFLHVLPAPFADPTVEQVYQAHFDRLKARRSLHGRLAVGEHIASSTAVAMLPSFCYAA